MPLIITSFASGIALAVAFPPDGFTSPSLVPWITTVGALILRRSLARLPEAMIAASWRAIPSELTPLS